MQLKKNIIHLLSISVRKKESYIVLNIRIILHCRTFAPFWAILKTLAEKLASLHMQLVHTWSDLIKDIIRYNEEQHKRHKSVGAQSHSHTNTTHSFSFIDTILVGVNIRIILGPHHFGPGGHRCAFVCMSVDQFVLYVTLKVEAIKCYFITDYLTQCKLAHLGILMLQN